MKNLILFFLLPLSAFAGVEKVSVQNLDMEYSAPHGIGTVERVGIGMSLISVPYSIELTRTDNSYELTSPYLDFAWINPVKFAYELEKLSAKKTSASAGGKKTHFIESEYLMAQPKGGGQYIAHKLKGNCEGDASGSTIVRILEDCRHQMNVVITKVEIPDDFFLLRLMEDMPRLPDLDYLGDNFLMSVREGNYELQMHLKYWFYAGLRVKGHLQYEDNHQTVAIRIDQVKFGFFNVTSLIMKKLTEVIKHPNVKVDPPWVRISLENLK